MTKEKNPIKLMYNVRMILYVFSLCLFSLRGFPGKTWQQQHLMHTLKPERIFMGLCYGSVTTGRTGTRQICGLFATQIYADNPHKNGFLNIHKYADCPQLRGCITTAFFIFFTAWMICKYAGNLYIH